MNWLALVDSVKHAPAHLALFGFLNVNVLLDVDPIALALNVLVERAEVVGVHSLRSLSAYIFSIDLGMA
ncbi:hypothetical protein D3C85_1003020 [compost metagenome]